MSKKPTKQTAKAAPHSVPAKRPGVRSLQTIEDLRRLQGRLIKQFMAGELGREDFKALVYASGVLCATLKHLEPEPKPAGWPDKIVVVSYEAGSAEEEQAIAAMNCNVLDPPGNE